MLASPARVAHRLVARFADEAVRELPARAPEAVDSALGAQLHRARRGGAHRHRRRLGVDNAFILARRLFGAMGEINPKPNGWCKTRRGISRLRRLHMHRGRWCFAGGISQNTNDIVSILQQPRPMCQISHKISEKVNTVPKFIQLIELKPEEAGTTGQVKCRQRLGGVLNFYYRDAA